MRQKIVFFTLLMTVALSACGSPAQSVAPTTVPQTGAVTDAVVRSAADEMPQILKLALATFSLEETDHPITAEQAKALLPLWKAVRSLNNSETAAPQEIQGLVSQIEKALTVEQMQAIQNLQLSREDMAAIAEKYGFELGGFQNLSPELRATMQAARQSGQAPPAGVLIGPIPGGGGPGMGGAPGGFSPQAQQTAMAQRGSMRSGVGLNSALLEALIKFLESKTQ
jgi:hypothetical protein